MTMQEYINWFKVNWPKTGLLVSIFLIIYLAVIVLPNNLLLVGRTRREERLLAKMFGADYTAYRSRTWF